MDGIWVVFLQIENLIIDFKREFLMDGFMIISMINLEMIF
jgi:hypothetical protein